MSFSQEVQLDLLQSDLANTLNVPEDNVVTIDLYNVCAGLIKEDRAEDADRILTAWHYDHKAVAELLAKTLPIEADSSKAQWHRELVNGMTIDVQKAIVCLQNYRHMDRIPSDFDMENISYAMNRVYNSMMLMQMERSWNRSNKTFEHQVLNKVVSAVEQHIYHDFAIEAADRLRDRRELVDGKWVLSGSPIDLSDPTQFDCEAIAPVHSTRFGKSQPDHGNGNADLPGVFFTVDRQTNTVTNINVIVFDNETDMHYDVPLPPSQTARILEELGTTHGFVWTVAEEERYKKQSVSERLSGPWPKKSATRNSPSANACPIRSFTERRSFLTTSAAITTERRDRRKARAGMTGSKPPAGKPMRSSMPERTHRPIEASSRMSAGGSMV